MSRSEKPVSPVRRGAQHDADSRGRGFARVVAPAACRGRGFAAARRPAALQPRTRTGFGTTGCGHGCRARRNEGRPRASPCVAAPRRIRSASLARCRCVRDGREPCRCRRPVRHASQSHAGTGIRQRRRATCRIAFSPDSTSATWRRAKPRMAIKSSAPTSCPTKYSVRPSRTKAEGFRKVRLPSRPRPRRVGYQRMPIEINFPRSLSTRVPATPRARLAA